MFIALLQTYISHNSPTQIPRQYSPKLIYTKYSTHLVFYLEKSQKSEYFVELDVTHKHKAKYNYEDECQT